MISRTAPSILWPALPYEAWKETLDTLHLWTQIVGKIKLTLNPFLNQWWEVALYITPRGLTTGRIPYQQHAFSIDFDFIEHALYITVDTGSKIGMPLRSQSVGAFYKAVMDTLKGVGITVIITKIPSEVPHPIPFAKDTEHASYERTYVERWFAVVLRTCFIFDRYRSRFRGKSSPVQFYWGSFDLNTTRFSGKTLPDKTDWAKGYHFMRYAENEENFAIGFWPGDERFPAPAFYSYMYPAPKGEAAIKVGPAIAYFNKKLSECILPYEDVRVTAHPEKEIAYFLDVTYKEYAKLAGWDIKGLTAVVPQR